MTVGVQENVFWFKIAVDNSDPVEVAQGLDQLGCVDLGPLLIESLFTAEVREKLATVEVVDDEVELGLRLESEVQFNYVGAVHVLEDVPLGLGLHQQIALDELVLAQDLHGEGQPRVLLAHEVHLPEGPSADDLDELEVFYANFNGWLQDVPDRVVGHKVAI
eukprot:CAMPEP_0170495136 /NCGR_PEP_ID=MMETSP0208-20121228/15034_1 /TAXON_ID=197538 /ORGANISM="Strombidium inclinatum, Strain S3" /LENGTH=161 /DNA_ID=CAMNT_0010771279 /DNA_START=594 /DNA_END=1079 /DNA_ORIENTATION=+